MTKYPFKTTIYTLALTSCILAGCETFQPAQQEKNTLAKDTITQIQQEQRAQAAPPVSHQEILNSLLPEVTQESLEPEEDRFDVSVKNIDARSFLLGLVDGTPYNLIVSPDINEKITLQLNNVTVLEVLRAVERIYPLIIEKDQTMLYVSSAETMTSVYPVDYLNLSRQGISRTSIAGQTVSGGKNDSNQSSSGNRSNNSDSSTALLNSSEITTETKANFWQELQNSLQLIVKDEEKANVVVSPHAGIVVVRALPKTQRLVEEYLGITQANLDRQVILEAKIIEVVLSDSFQSGIDWTQMNTVNDGASLKITQSGQVVQTEASEFPMNGIFSLLYQATSFQTAIDLLKTQGDVQILSSPRVSTVNNQKAVIKVGSDEFFVTDVSTTTVTGTSTATTPDVTLTPFFSGISLDVTPQINRQGDIVLHIHPVVSEVNDQKKTLTLGQDQFTLPLALTNIRESDSIVRTSNQQVIVIGGLMQNQVQNKVTATPLLSDIPMLGELFKQNRESVVKSELVILLKASLVDKQFNFDEISRIKKRFEN
ncbi:pilus (MSHA type) biogenesis protein MshL [Aliikangiella maris]|uniref:Pilus (MSHA type) biogenesis protein MshL n=2 Tax=Aliikangiella maris TaxID=3162458 RepID=A0ABV2BUR8_9GAMM